MENNDRIQINGVWYVKENTEEKLKSIKLDPVDSQVCSVENDDFAGYIVSFFLKKGIRIIKIKFHSFRFHQHHLNLILMRHVKNFSV